MFGLNLNQLNGSARKQRRHVHNNQNTQAVYDNNGIYNPWNASAPSPYASIFAPYYAPIIDIPPPQPPIAPTIPYKAYVEYPTNMTQAQKESIQKRNEQIKQENMVIHEQNVAMANPHLIQAEPQQAVQVQMPPQTEANILHQQRLQAIKEQAAIQIQENENALMWNTQQQLAGLGQRYATMPSFTGRHHYY